jgi:antitoxin component of MazEF toxin-antitoxin module
MKGSGVRVSPSALVSLLGTLDSGCLVIRVYTCGMKIVKVRRVGNSNVVSIPREFESSGYAPGSSVLIEGLEDGELRILPTERVHERIQDVAARLVSEHPEALEILANHDPDVGSPV